MNLKYCSEYKDMLNIYNLITKIDKNYKLIFDAKHKEFIIINSAKNNQVCLKFKDFSLNILKLLQKSRVENLNKIINEIDDFNNDLMLKNKEKFKENLINKMIETKNYLKRASSISKNSINKIIGEKIC